MAKKTKDSNLTLEERLEQALIPNWDEPYKLPENWCWVKLSTVCSLENGEKSTEKGLVYLDAKTLRGVTEPQTRDSGIVVNKDQKVILVDGENSGEVFVVPYRGYMGSTFKILNIVTNADEMYIRYFIDQNRERLRNSKVGSAIPHLNKDLFFDLKLPFPPLNEQKRIVAQIESLFAKLDEAQEKAQEVVDGFEIRKAAILHKAFSGELTAKWKLAHSEICEIWKQKKFSMITHNFDSQRIPLSQAERNNLARTYDYYGASGIIDKVDRFLFEGRKLLIGEDGANLITRSKPIAFIADGQYWVNNHAHVITTTSEMLLDFLCYYINSIDLTPYVTGSAQPKMTQAKMNSIPVPVPSIQEQTEIVRLLDDMIKKEQQAKETAEAVIEQIDTMKKAILARAFRGELGTNDPSEESAVELLKRVLSGGEN